MYMYFLGCCHVYYNVNVDVHFVSFLSAQDNFGIVEPFPENIYPIEYTSAQVTCVAFDSSGEKTPDRIQFMRKSNFAIYRNLTASDNLFFTTRTELEEVAGPDGPGRSLLFKNTCCTCVENQNMCSTLIYMYDFKTETNNDVHLSC